jgi:Uncharacterized protein conserved in bacteria
MEFDSGEEASSLMLLGELSQLEHLVDVLIKQADTLRKFLDDIEPARSFEYGANLNDIRVAKDFKLSEFQCPHCLAVKLHPLLIERLQTIRDKVGKPVIVTSGYRCEVHNRRVGGAANSQHLYGKAADIYIPGLTIPQLAAVAEKYFQDGGLGVYPGHVHVDVRGTKARWN